MPSDLDASMLGRDHFALLGLPRRFALQRDELDTAWRDLQSAVHPDRHAMGSESERRVALQWASRVNEAYRVLRSPWRRARYLCELAGHSIDAESNTTMDAAFLMQQLEWREALEQARDERDDSALSALTGELQDARQALVGELTQLLDAQSPDVLPDYPTAVTKVREWMFIERLLEEVDAAHA